VSDSLWTEGYERALELMRVCASADGFVASPTELANYRRVWSRDGVVLGLAALASGQEDLVHTFGRTLLTLAEHQGPHGEIPSNVDTVTGRVSYGGTTGRVDASLWFVVGCGRYWSHTGDRELLDAVLPAVEKARFLLGAWEFNNRGLIYVPQAGDWADEYLHHGYVLYDQLLYLRAQQELTAIHEHLHGGADHALTERMTRLKDVLRATYWFQDGDGVPDHVYHEVMYKNGREAASEHLAGLHWLPFFSPQGYGYRFDTLANILVSLFDVADDEQRARVDAFIEGEGMGRGEMPVLPAFHPVIEPVDEDWGDLQMTFSYTFRNRPYEYHNGGLWPMVNGFAVMDLARRGEREGAERLTGGIHTANALPRDGEAWSFPEYVHGLTLASAGTRLQGWSAAAAVLAHHALAGTHVFDDPASDGDGRHPSDQVEDGGG
jgi:glycogen debranching enzyme